MKNILRYAIAAAVPAVVAVGCRKAEEPPVTDVVVAAVDSLPAEPDSEHWSRAPELAVNLLLQDQVDPRLLAPSTDELRVRALTDGSRVAFRLEWTDATKDDLATSASFTDACAVQLPAVVAPDVPSPQMGEKGRPVRITFWSAGWQAALEGRGGSLNDLYPNASIDHYPFEAPSLEPGSAEQKAMAQRYAPAAALGNMMAGPHGRAVQDLVAEGPGTLATAESTGSEGRGERSEDGWSVVISRPLPRGFGSAVPAQVAFAVWEGSQGEVGARKMRTGWIALVSPEKP